MPDKLPDIGDPGFFTLPGCASLFGIFMAVLGIAASQEIASQCYLAGCP